jgi:septal ring factor EnvC (AmiA/AmiB activator)
MTDDEALDKRLSEARTKVWRRLPDAIAEIERMQQHIAHLEGSLRDERGRRKQLQEECRRLENALADHETAAYETAERQGE